MIMKVDCFNDDSIVDLFDSFLLDDYFIYGSGFIDVMSFLVGGPEYSVPIGFCRKLKRAVSYDAKCLAKGCPTVTMEAKDMER